MSAYSFMQVSRDQQVSIAHEMKNNHAVLLTEWVASDNNTTHWYTLYLSAHNGLTCVSAPLNTHRPILFDLSAHFPVCVRLQRSIYELTRIPTQGAKDKRLWLNHGNFPIGMLSRPRKLHSVEPYAFKKVRGHGVHEIPVGPVHAGIIEPGHFRFSAVGERVLKLETRLGYTHKGIHALLNNKSIDEAAKIIARVSGDSTVAYASAFAMACEAHQQFQPSMAVKIDRAILLERERLANHINDIGAIINDAGFPSLCALFHSLKEVIHRHNEQYVGHRYAMDCIKPFAEQTLIAPTQYPCILNELTQLESELKQLKIVMGTHDGLQDRLHQTGIVTQSLAHSLGLLGLTAKASGIENDSRALSKEIYPLIAKCGIESGDVFARATVRYKECFESIQLIRHWIKALSDHSEKYTSTVKPIGVGVVEGWRGPVSVIVSLQGEKINWCHFHDPSWQNWLAVEYAVMNNIVADFPLINKSFNLSYSGHDG